MRTAQAAVDLALGHSVAVVAKDVEIGVMAISAIGAVVEVTQVSTKGAGAHLPVVFEAQKVLFVEVLQVAVVVLLRAANADQPKRFFKDKRISSTKGLTSEQSIRIAGATPVTFQDTGSVYMALQQNKVVGLVTNTMTALKLVNQAKASGVELALAKEPMALEPIGACMRRDEPAFLAKVNESLATMEKAGEVDAIWDRWIGPNTEYKMVREDKVQSLSSLKFDPLP